jgi:hypothetical protein
MVTFLLLLAIEASLMPFEELRGTRQNYTQFEMTQKILSLAKNSMIILNRNFNFDPQILKNSQ